MPAIAKTDPKTGATRSLVGHSLDVANAVLAMLTHSVARERLSTAAGLSLTAVHVHRLAVLAGVHDFGKASNGFQERIRGVSRGTGHGGRRGCPCYGARPHSASRGVPKCADT